MLHTIITSLILICLCVVARSDPLPDSYNYAFFFQVNIASTIVYSPTQTSVIYSGDSPECFTFRESLQEDQSPQKTICLNESIFAIEYNPQADRVYMVTNFNNQTQSIYRFYMFQVTQGMIEEQPYLVYVKTYVMQIVAYPIVDISKDNKIAFSLNQQFYVLNMTQQLIAQLLYDNFSMPYQVVELKWHPLQKNTLFVAGQGQNQVFNLENKQFQFFSDLSTIHMNIMYNGSIVLLQPQVQESNPYSSVYVFSYLQGQVNFIQKYTDFTLYKPALCSLQGNIMGLVRDLTQMYIFEATYSEIQEGIEQVMVTGTFTFERISIVQYFPSISDGSMSLDGNQIYLRSYQPIKKITRCGEGMYQTGFTCQNCSLSCFTCHKSRTLCTSCNTGDYVQNQKCISCISKYKGCVSCSPTRCLTCNETVNFNILPSQQGSCQCKYGAYLVNGGNECKLCNVIFEGCVYCENEQKCLTCDQEKYEMDEESNTCKLKSMGWIIGVGIGVGVLIIVGVGILVWYVKKRKSNRSSEGYSKFSNEDNQKIRRKKESFTKSSFEGVKQDDVVESNDKIEPVNVKKSNDGRINSKDDGKIEQK